MKRFWLAAGGLALVALGFHLGQAFLQGQAPERVVVPRELTSYRDIVKRVLPGVVSVEALARPGKGGKTDEPRRPGEDPDRIGFGSGFVISPRGVVVTNYHVVEGADRVAIAFKDGKRLVSRKVFTDAKTDLAIVLLDGKEAIPYLQFGDSNAMEIGDRVLAVGAPFGLTGTVTSGIVSSVGRSLRMNLYEDFIQTDAAINPGNSGGPLISMEGKVIGITSAIKSRSGGFSGIGLAISSNLGKKIVASLLKEGTVRRGYLGVGIRDLTEERARELGLRSTEGVEVTAVYPGTPGEKAGVRVGDVLLRVGGKRVKDGRMLQDVVASQAVGKAVALEVVRDRRERVLDATITEQPKKFGSTKPGLPDIDHDGVESKKAGMALLDLTPELRSALKYAASARGPIILRMQRSGLAARAGLKPGQLVVRVDGKAVRTAREAVAALEAGSAAAGIDVVVHGPDATSLRVTLQAGERRE